MNNNKKEARPNEDKNKIEMLKKGAPLPCRFDPSM